MKKNAAIFLVAALSTLFGCGPSEEKKKATEKHRNDRQEKIVRFVEAGPVVSSTTKTSEGVLQTIDIPVTEDSLAMVKRCVLFVSNSGAPTLTCEEPKIHFTD